MTSAACLIIMVRGRGGMGARRMRGRVARVSGARGVLVAVLGSSSRIDKWGEYK